LSGAGERDERCFDLICEDALPLKELFLLLLRQPVEERMQRRIGRYRLDERADGLLSDAGAPLVRGWLVGRIEGDDGSERSAFDMLVAQLGGRDEARESWEPGFGPYGVAGDGKTDGPEEGEGFEGIEFGE
jgi:hypothetical protein